MEDSILAKINLLKQEVSKKNNWALYNEKELQAQLGQLLSSVFDKVDREQKLASSCKIDFMVDDDTGIEVKIKTKYSASQIYDQCERYCQTGKLKRLILITSRSLGFPKELNGVDCYYISLTRSL